MVSETCDNLRIGRQSANGIFRYASYLATIERQRKIRVLVSAETLCLLSHAKGEYCHLPGFESPADFERSTNPSHLMTVPDFQNAKTSELSSDSQGLMTQHRRTTIAQVVRDQGTARVVDLAERFQVSEVTIRNDLDLLEREGKLIRDRGGAIAALAMQPVTSLLQVEERAALNMEAKRRIASAAAQRVSPGETILMDAGTTVVHMGGSLKGIAPLTVVTNALNVALDLGATRDIEVILLGGSLNRNSSSTVGLLAGHNLSEMFVQKLFLGTQALDIEHGLTDSTLEIAQVKRAMIRSAREVILLADSSKWGKAGFIKVAPLTDVDTIITDAGIPAEFRTAIEGLGIELIVV